MKTLLARNRSDGIQKTLAYLDEEGVKLDGIVRAPIPVTIIYQEPTERAEAQMSNPFTVLINSMTAVARDSSMARARDGMLRQLKAGNSKVAAQIGASQVYLQINVEGRLDLMMVRPIADELISFPPSLCDISILLEYFATALKLKIGFLYLTTMELNLLRPGVKGADGPGIYDGKIRPAPIMSLPVSRWNRELDTLVKLGPDECPTLYDPWLEGTLRPMWLAWKEYGGGGPDLMQRVGRHLADVNSPDWQAAAWEWFQRSGDA